MVVILNCSIPTEQVESEQNRPNLKPQREVYCPAGQDKNVRSPTANAVWRSYHLLQHVRETIRGNGERAVASRPSDRNECQLFVEVQFLNDFVLSSA